MGYFKQQNKDLFGSHHLMYQRYQPPKDSYDMIYGGFQSMGVPLNHPFQMGIFHETTIQRAWGSPMELPGKTAWDQPNDLVGSIGSSRFNPPMAWDRLRRGKAHGFQRHHRHNPDLMFSLPWAYRGNFCVFLTIDKLREGSRNCVGSGGCLQELDMFEE